MLTRLSYGPQWRCLHGLTLLVVLALGSTASAQTDSTWNETTGNWTSASLWTPAVPQNGMPAGTTYNATVNGGGTITLDTAIVIERLNFSSGTITGPNSLTMNAASTFSGGTFSGTGGF